MARFGITRPDELVDEYLHDHETVLYDKAPQWQAWVWNQWFDLLVAIVVVLIMVVAHDDPLVLGLGFVGELALLGFIGWRYLDHIYTRYVLTDYRVLRLSGVFRRDHEWISWKKVTDVSVHRSISDRWFGTATIRIQSANELSGFKAMTDVPDPLLFAQTIVDLVNASTGPVELPAQPTPPAPPATRPLF